MINKNNDLAKLQLALVLSSINDTHKDGNINATDVINRCIKEKNEIEERLLKLRESSKKNKDAKISKRIQKYLDANEIYLMPHLKVPKVFTKDEVDELNRTRKKDNQLERLDNGLLKHHCCFPECPDYLDKSFATDKDIKTHKRTGLFLHLKIIAVTDRYYKGIHSAAKKQIMRKVTYQRFLEEMYSQFIKDNLESDKIKDIKYVIDEIYKSYEGS
jgi:hypothetical protein